MSIDFNNVKFGRNKPTKKYAAIPDLNHDPFLINLEPPKSLIRAVEPGLFKMFYNDKIGDCSCAGVMNALIAWEHHFSGTATLDIPEINAVSLYSAVTGYNPDDPSTDQGAMLADVLAYGTAAGYPTRHWKYTPLWGSFDYSNQKYLAAVMARFVTGYIGITIRQGDMDLLNDHQVLDVGLGMDPTILGGHLVLLYGYTGLNPKDHVQLITWGGIVEATWDWVLDRAEEAHAMAFRQLLPKGLQSATCWDSMVEQNKAFLDANKIAV